MEGGSPGSWLWGGSYQLGPPWSKTTFFGVHFSRSARFHAGWQSHRDLHSHVVTSNPAGKIRATTHGLVGFCGVWRNYFLGKSLWANVPWPQNLPRPLGTYHLVGLEYGVHLLGRFPTNTPRQRTFLWFQSPPGQKPKPEHAPSFAPGPRIHHGPLAPTTPGPRASTPGVRPRSLGRHWAPLAPALVAMLSNTRPAQMPKARRMRMQRRPKARRGAGTVRGVPFFLLLFLSMYLFLYFFTKHIYAFTHLFVCLFIYIFKTHIR